MLFGKWELKRESEINAENAHASNNIYWYIIVGFSGYNLCLYVLCQYMKKNLWPEDWCKNRVGFKSFSWRVLQKVFWPQLYDLMNSRFHIVCEKNYAYWFSGQISVKETLPSQLSERKKSPSWGERILLLYQSLLRRSKVFLIEFCESISSETTYKNGCCV